MCPGTSSCSRPIPSLVASSSTSAICAFGGGDPYEYLAKYPSRYYGVHVKDFKPGKAAVPVGSGDLDWKRIFTLVKAANIRNIVAEVGAYGASTLQGQPLAPPDYSVLELYKRSAEFLRAFSAV